MKEVNDNREIKLLRVYEKNLMTLNTFLERNEISRSTFYQLKRASLGPKEIRIGRAVYVSYREERRWTRAMSKASASAKPNKEA